MKRNCQHIEKVKLKTKEFTQSKSFFFFWLIISAAVLVEQFSDKSKPGCGRVLVNESTSK